MAAENTSSSSGRTSISITVAGDPGTGKSSLILALVADSFPEIIPHVLPPTRLPDDYFPFGAPITITDTSADPENNTNRITQLQTADVIVLTYACDSRTTLDRLTTYWLPELRRLEVKSPVIIAGCRVDLRVDDEDQTVKQSIMQSFPEIEAWIVCSAHHRSKISEVFYYAQDAVLYPRAPIFDRESGALKRRCISALKRIFILCDKDGDGALSDADLNDFQVRCFETPLPNEDIAHIKNVVREKIPEGINPDGFLNLVGFLYLHALFIESGRLETTWIVLRKFALFIESGRLETTWIVLRKFGYGDDLRIRNDVLSTTILKRAPDQCVELTHDALEFLKMMFSVFDIHCDGVLRPSELNELFSTAPENPWSVAPYKDVAEKNVEGGLSLGEYLSNWALMTLLDPVASMANLIYLGYNCDIDSAFHVTRRRRLERKRRHSERNVFQCFVFGPKNAGKSELLNSLVGRNFSESYSATTSEQFAASLVELPEGDKKTLVMREVPEDQVKMLLSSKEYLAACDVAVFVHDSSDEASWEKAKELLLQVASYGEDNGFEMPCLIVSTKDDLDSCSLAIQDSTRVSQELGIETPIPISVKLGDLNNVFRRIISAAQHPHLGVPETEAGKTRKEYRRFVNRSLVFASVGVATAVAALAAYKVYASRKSS